MFAFLMRLITQQAFTHGRWAGLNFRLCAPEWRGVARLAEGS